MTEEDYHEVKAEIAMSRFQGADNPFTGETDEYGVKLRRRGYFEIANEITDEEVRARWASAAGRAKQARLPGRGDAGAAKPGPETRIQ